MEPSDTRHLHLNLLTDVVSPSLIDACGLSELHIHLDNVFGFFVGHTTRLNGVLLWLIDNFGMRQCGKVWIWTNLHLNTFWLSQLNSSGTTIAVRVGVTEILAPLKSSATEIFAEWIQSASATRFEVADTSPHTS